ncbi:hypothetical protein FXE30_09015 [Vibrio cholerae]|uniref:hypothetical protein n=1 Tax=Vibrio cholerae TaxID=666 RepID=UPI00084D6E4A|nr:hypothetical protein [Vibrio cholerae]ELJ8546601.1 hypothetical protein [Vibrio cholerae]ELY5188820.1 hypothetical protein [Vibrio cholerae]ELY5287002.1 hypothetical protein [Vibrio cholerae]OEG77459.1 hypothetical protein VCS12_09780 [Vibrio cholerae]TXZ94216.1 hypothetical protein FXE30_09015 [Vibrio cholerae]
MKTPLLGTFVLSWLAYNHDHVAKLLFSDNTQRIALIESTPFNLNSDLLLPLALALAYLFIVPLAQWGIDIVKYWLVDKRRTATHHHHLLEKYRSLTRVAKQQSKTSSEYWQELYRNRAEDAGRQLINLKETVSHLKAQQRELENQLSIASSNYSMLDASNKKLDEELNESKRKAADFSQRYSAQKELSTELLGLSKNVIEKFGSSDLKWLTLGLPGIDINKLVGDVRAKLNSVAVLDHSKNQYQQIFDSLDSLESELSNYLVDMSNKCNSLDNTIAEVVRPLIGITNMHRG